MNETVRICPICGAPVPAEAPQGLCPKCVMAGAADTVAATPPAGAAGEALPVATVAAAFPHLEVVELIGAGGMGAVYKARQPKLERWVALKVLPDTIAADPAFAERFSREARVLARLNHPNIVTVYDFGQSGGFFYLLMEYVDGVNLREAMVAGRFTPAQALALVPRICEALQYAHDEGILHRDIKPENILLDAKGRVKIADFGIAKLIGARKDVTLTAKGAAIGTPLYMAPEQLERPQEIDQRADIYSLGVVFYEMLTGELPIGRFAPPSEKSAVDPRVDPIVLRALERDREKRFRTVSEVKTRVENLGAEVSAASAGAPAGVAPPGLADAVKWSRKAVLGAVFSGLSLFLGVALAGLIFFALFFLLGQRGGVGGGEILLLLGAVLVVGGLGLAGLILGVMARREIRDSGGRLRGGGLALFAIWAPPVLALGVFLLFLFIMSYVTLTPGLRAYADKEPGLLLRETYKRQEEGRFTEMRWIMSVAPGRAVKVSLNVLSNGVPALDKPLSTSFVTPEPGDRVEGQFSMKLLPNSGTEPGQPPWQAQLDAESLASTVMEFPHPVSPLVEWWFIRDLPRLEVAMNGGTSYPLLQGVQRFGTGPDARTTRWETRLEISVKPPPPLVEIIGSNTNPPPQTP